MLNPLFWWKSNTSLDLSRPFNDCINSSYLKCLNKAWTIRIIWLHTNERSWHSRWDNINNGRNETCSGKELKTPSSFRITFISYSTWLQTAIKKKILLAKWDCAMEDLWTALAETVSGSLKQNGNKLLQDMFHKLKKINKKSSVVFCSVLFSTIKAIIF